MTLKKLVPKIGPKREVSLLKCLPLCSSSFADLPLIYLAQQTYNALLYRFGLRLLPCARKGRMNRNQKPLNHLLIHIIMNCFSFAPCAVGRGCSLIGRPVAVGRSVGRSVMKFWRDALTCSVCLFALPPWTDAYGRATYSTTQVKWSEMQLRKCSLIAERCYAFAQEIRRGRGGWTGGQARAFGQPQFSPSPAFYSWLLLVFKQRLSFLSLSLSLPLSLSLSLSLFLPSEKRAFNFGVHSAFLHSHSLMANIGRYACRIGDVLTCLS